MAVELDQGGVVPAPGRLLGVLGQLLILGDPVDVAGEAQGVELEAVEDGGPLAEDPVGVLVPAQEALGGLQEVGPLDLDGGHGGGARGAHRPAPVGVPGDVLDRLHRVLQLDGAVPAELEELGHQGGGADLEGGGVLGAVGVPDDDVQAPEAPPGEGLVAEVEDGAPAEADAVGDVHRDEGGPLGELEGGDGHGRPAPGEGGEDPRPPAPPAPARASPQGGGGDHPRPGEDLPGDEEGEEPLDHVPAPGADPEAVVLVVAVGVAEVVGVVLDEEDLALEPELGHRLDEDLVAGALGGDEVLQGPALGGGVLQVAGVQVEAAPVEEESPVPGDLPPLPGGRLDEAEAAPGEDAVLDPDGGLGRALAGRAGAGVLGLGAEEGAVHQKVLKSQVPGPRSQVSSRDRPSLWLET
jgi:hypothetical protein